jgi:hypothetical protein
MGYLGKQQHQQGLDPNALAQLLGNQKQQAQSASPDAMAILEDVLGGKSGFHL